MAGLALAVILGVWQGSAVWRFLEQATGVHGQTTTQRPVSTPAPPASPTSVPVELVAAPADKPVPPPVAEPATPDQGPAGLLQKAAASGEPVPAPVVIPFKVADLEDVAAAAEKLKQKRELTVRNLQIQGVRMQGRDSRALIDGNPVGLGELVGGEGIRLKAIEPSRLLFSDAVGNEYPRSY